MNVKALQFCKLVVYALLSATDLLLTYRLVKQTGGVIYESNPIASAWLHAYGWVGLAVFKLAAILLVAGVAIYVGRRRPATAARLLSFACCAVAGVVLYSCWLANSFQPSFRPSSWALARIDTQAETWQPQPFLSRSFDGRPSAPRRGHARGWAEAATNDDGPAATALYLPALTHRGRGPRFPMGLE
jgi:hypothetical protein